MLSPLLTAINTYFDGASGLLTQITGGLHFEETPSGVSMPYAIAYVISASATSKYGGVSYSEPVIQFTVFGQGARVALLLIEALITKFDEHSFTLSSGTQINATRQHEPIPLPDFPQQNESGNPCYGYVVTYAYSIAN
jgi:hypothetical protein